MLNNKDKGFTLLELLLYIALFTIVIFGFIKTYIVLAESYEWYQGKIQRNEITFYAYEITRFSLDKDILGANVQHIASSTERILKFYPKYKLKSFKIENHSIGDTNVAHVSFILNNSTVTFDILVI